MFPASFLFRCLQTRRHPSRRPSAASDRYRRRIFFEPLEERRVLATITLGGAGGQAGELDTTFDVDGWVTTHVNDEVAHDVVVDNLGRTIAVGKIDGGQNNFLVARYTTTGQLDPSFGAGGIVTIDFGGNDIAKGVALDGAKIVVAGQSQNPLDDNFDVAIARLNPDGTLDGTFGTGGKFLWVSTATLEHVEDVAVQSNGSVVVVGQRVDTATFEFDWHVSRVTSAGVPDTSFDIDGVRTIDFLAPAAEEALGVAIQHIGGDERIVVAGYIDDSSGEVIKVLRLLSSNGAHDPDFGSGGQATGLVTGQAADVVALPNGNIYVAGTIHEGFDNKMIVASFTSGGLLNNGFGTSGIARIAKSTFDLVASDLVVDSAGNVVVAGTVLETSTFVVGRLTSAGTLDASFGVGGQVEADLEAATSAEKARAVAIDPLTGNIVVAGQRTKAPNADDFALARFVAAGGSEPPEFDGFEGDERPLDFSFTDLTVGTHSIVVDWGDGTTTTFLPNVPSDTISTQHTFADDSDLVKVKVIVTSTGACVTSASVIAHIDNLPPVASPLSGPSGGVRNQPLLFAGSFTDPGALDVHTVLVTWGDGTTSLAEVNPATRTFSAIHAYETTGTRSVTYTVADDDLGQASGALASSVQTVEVQIQPDPTTPGATMLAIGGTTGADNISVCAVAGGVEAFINAVSFGVYAPSMSIAAFAGSSDDEVQVGGSIPLTAWLYGGNGNDRMKGGAGSDVIMGQGGDDLLVGGSGRDLIIGGLGADRIVGNNDDDILISGTTDHDANVTALAAILAEWTSTRSASARVANISGTGTGDRLNGSYFLTDAKVHDDGVRDLLTGSSGFDWFFANLSLNGDDSPTKDKITDLNYWEFAKDIDFIES